MKRSLMLLSAFALGLSVSAQDATTTKRLVETQTIADYTYSSKFNDKVGDKVNSSGFECNLGAGKTSRTDRNGKSYKNYIGENLPATGATYFGNNEQQLSSVTIGEDIYYGAKIGNASNPVVITGLEKDDEIHIYFIATQTTDGATSIIENAAVPYAVGTTNAAKFSFSKYDEESVATELVGYTDDENLATTFTSGQKIVCTSVTEGASPYFATYNFVGLLQKVTITRSGETTTYDYEAEARRYFAEKTKSIAASNFSAVDYTNETMVVSEEGLIMANTETLTAKTLKVGSELVATFNGTMTATTTDATIAYKGGDAITSGANIKSGDTIVVTALANEASEANLVLTATDDTKVSKLWVVNKTYEEVTPLTVTIATIENGNVAFKSPYDVIAAGDSIEVSAVANAGYKLSEISITDATEKALELSATNKFAMPESNVTINAIFVVDDGEYYATVTNTVKTYTDGSSKIVANLNDDFAAIVDENKVATNEENNQSKLTVSTENITLTAVGGTIPSNIAGSGAQNIDKDGNVTEWNSITWTTNNQSDINFSYLLGTGTPYISISAEEIVTDGTPTGTYKAAYEYYEADGSKGLPTTGLYYEFETKATGVLQVGIWANKGSRITYVVDKETAKALDYKVEGYINGQNNEDGTKKYLSNDEIVALHDASTAADYVIGAGGQPFWGYIYFPVEAGKSYLVFQHSSQIGFSGYRFTEDATIADYTTKAIAIPEETIAMYKVTAEGTDSVKVSASATEVTEGETVTFTATATASYKVESVKATVGGAEVAVTTNEDGTYSITAGAGDIVFTVTQALKDSENPTPVENIIANQGAEDNTIYDLSGRKVVNPTRGVYIKNGKKFIVK
ncbi:MAG: hypothetical protein J6Y72_06375 [Bacteroidales bacterium]|nr:hypothetical protein [Bacteroidales bacterium]